jgi:hypothetical protein
MTTRTRLVRVETDIMIRKIRRRMQTRGLLISVKGLGHVTGVAIHTS